VALCIGSGGPADGARVRAAAHRVARSLGPLVSVLNPNLIVVGGEVGRTGYDVVESPLLRALKRYTLRPALRDREVLGATLERRTAFQGAIPPVSGRRAMTDTLVSFP
jgi:predicted NBD/HSP70 family sugar kinase